MRSPSAAWKPALSAAALPKLRRKRMPRIRGSSAASWQIVRQEPSVEPSSTMIDLQLVAVRVGNLIQLAHQLRQAFGFVEDGNDDGEHDECSAMRSAQLGYNGTAASRQWHSIAFLLRAAPIYRIPHDDNLRHQPNEPHQHGRNEGIGVAADAAPKVASAAASRTPRPPGSIETKPATTANATAATSAADH